jgi:hypothetical protein
MAQSSFSSDAVSTSNLSDIESDIIFPRAYVPDLLQRTYCRNKPRSMKYIIPTEDTLSLFEGWWQETLWRKRNPSQKIAWNTSRNKSEAWRYFRALATLTTGEPIVQCVRCNDALKHPTIKNGGTNAMTRHVRSGACTKHSTDNGHGAITEHFPRQKV